MKVKQILFKVIPFVSIAVLVLAFGFIFIPHSFVMFRENFAQYSFSGFEVFFLANQYFTDNISTATVSAAGIITISFLVLAVVANVFANKASFLKLIAGILTSVTGFMFMAMQLWMLFKYASYTPVALWIPYINGTFLLACGGLTIWGAVDLLVKEKNAPFTANKSYSYLKKK